MSSILKLIEAPQLSIEGQIKDLKDKGITFSLNTSKYKTNYSVNRFLSDDVKVSKHCRDTRMSNAAIRAIVTLLYTYKTFVADINNHNEQALAVNKFIDRCYKNINYYQSNDLIIATFDFLKKIIDKTFNM